MSGYTTMMVEHHGDGIALATLNRPKRLNAMTFTMLAELTLLQREIAENDDIRVLVITGAGRGFSAGLDLDDAVQLAEMDVIETFRGQQGWAMAVAGFRLGTTPVIAAVNGPAAGAGLGLALAADVCLASSAASFTAAFVRIGLSGGDVGVSWMLPRIVGIGMASELLLTGRQIDANEAMRIGLVNHVHEPDELLDAAMSLAGEIASKAPYGIQLTKRVLQQNVDAPSLEAALETENRGQVLLTCTSDMREALAAFREKRPAQFTGH